jgi:hypothetical protein
MSGASASGGTEPGLQAVWSHFLHRPKATFVNKYGQSSLYVLWIRTSG